MTSLLKKLGQCFGISSLILVMNYGEMLGGGQDIRMHYPFPLTSICLAYIADIFSLGLIFFAALAPIRRNRYYAAIRLLLAVLIPAYLLTRVEPLIPFDTSGVIPALAIVWAGILLTMRLRFPKSYRLTMRGASALAASFGLFALASIGQLLWVATWKPGPQYRHAAWESAKEPPRDHAKVVWIVFDELSYDQTFEHRAHDLNLAAFDALRGQSTLFTNVQPAGIKTVKVIPSLLTGHEVDSFEFSFGNRLRVHYADQSGWHPLTGDDTIFGDARNAGFRTAAVGWYNPYCTVYSTAIEDCYWQNLDKFDGPMNEGDPFWRNTWEPLRQVVREAKSPVRAERDNCTADVRQRFKTNVDLKAHALQVLQTDQADFIYLHFALPHSPNIWSRATDGYTQFCDSSYLDNLALTDRELGIMMDILRASPRWKNTTVIVEGDHSWRTEIWQNQPTWTDEDDEISRRGFDTRPALLIHWPGQQQPETNATPWPLIRVHEVLEKALRN